MNDRVYKIERSKVLVNEQNVRKNVRNDLIKSSLWNMQQKMKNIAQEAYRQVMNTCGKS